MQYQIINNLLPWDNTNESSSNRDILLKTLIINWFTFYTRKPELSLLPFFYKIFWNMYCWLFFSWVGELGGMRFCFFVFLKATTENPFVCTVPLLPLSWNQNLHMKHFKCSLNKHKWNPYNELCLETHEICTILIIFLEQMDLKIALKTLIKKVWLR